MSKNKLFFITNEDNVLNKSDFIKKSYWSTWILVGISFLIVGLLWNSLPNKIPLFYSLPWGEERLAQKGWLALLPSLGLIFSGINWAISGTWWKREEFLQKILAISSLVETSLLIFIMLNIVGLVL